MSMTLNAWSRFSKQYVLVVAGFFWLVQVVVQVMHLTQHAIFGSFATLSHIVLPTMFPN
jgi:hypothetical protein